MRGRSCRTRRSGSGRRRARPVLLDRRVDSRLAGHVQVDVGPAERVRRARRLRLFAGGALRSWVTEWRRRRGEDHRGGEETQKHKRAGGADHCPVTPRHAPARTTNGRAPRVLERRPHLAQPRARQRRPLRARSSRVSTTTRGRRASEEVATARRRRPSSTAPPRLTAQLAELLDALGPPFEGRPGVGFPRRPRRRAAAAPQKRGAISPTCSAPGRAFIQKPGARLAYW